MANEIVMTKEGYDDLVKELNELKNDPPRRDLRENPCCTRLRRSF